MHAGSESKLIYLKSFLKYLLIILIIIDISLFVRKFVFTFVRIEGSSMEPTLKDSELVFVSRLAVHFDNIDRNDIVVFKPFTGDDPTTNDKETDVYYIKRVIGLPGETITITPDYKIVIVDAKGKNINYKDEYCLSDMNRGINLNLTDDNDFETITLGKDEYFVLGDNRAVSRDSRSEAIGPINKNTMVGVYKFGF